MGDDAAGEEQKKKRTFRKFAFKGVDLDALLDMSTDELVKLFHARARRRFQRGLKRKPLALIKRLRKAKREAAPGEKPSPVRTHLRNMIIVPEMIGSQVGVYNGKVFNTVEIKVRRLPKPPSSDILYLHASISSSQHTYICDGDAIRFHFQVVERGEQTR